MSSTADFIPKPAPLPPLGSRGLAPAGLKPPRLRRRGGKSFRRVRKLIQFPIFALVILSGYLIWGRTFAYWGFGGLFPAEILFAWAILKRQGGFVSRFRQELRARPLLPVTMLLFLGWGILETVRGFAGGYTVQDSLRGLATHYYPLMIYMGLALSASLPLDLLRKYFTYINIAIGIAQVVSVVLNDAMDIQWHLPWTRDVDVIGTPVPAIALVIAVALARKIGASFIVAFLCGILAMVIGPRATIVGGLLPLAFLMLRPGRKVLAMTLAIGVCVLALVGVALPSLFPDLGGRIGSLSPTRIAARVTAIVNPDLAHRISESEGEDSSYIDEEAGTVDWRKKFWSGVVDSLQTPLDWAVGHGYGFSLGTIMVDNNVEGFDESIRTPHNFGVYLLGYTGVVGCALYVWILIALAIEISRCANSPARDALAAALLCSLIIALSGNFLESPFGAVPAYVSFGLLLGHARNFKRSGAASRSQGSPRGATLFGKRHSRLPGLRPSVVNPDFAPSSPAFR